jgi:hypothetical protein
MMRFGAAALLAILTALPLAVLPAPPVTWVVGISLVVGGAGVIVPAVPLVSAGASLALVAYALALVIARPAMDPIGASGLGTALVLLLALVHFSGRVRGASIGPSVIASQLRRWLAVAAVGASTALVLTGGGVALRGFLAGRPLPVVVVAAALGAVIAAGGVIVLVTTARS